jgi:hypothetical protein
MFGVRRNGTASAAPICMTPLSLYATPTPTPPTTTTQTIDYQHINRVYVYVWSVWCGGSYWDRIEMTRSLRIEAKGTTSQGIDHQYT